MKPITSKRGCKQGDQISPSHFILGVDVVGKILSDNKNIKGKPINNKTFFKLVCRRYSNLLRKIT